jgi:hypothetical protein
MGKVANMIDKRWIDVESTIILVNSKFTVSIKQLIVAILNGIVNPLVVELDKACESIEKKLVQKIKELDLLKVIYCSLEIVSPQFHCVCDT